MTRHVLKLIWHRKRANLLLITEIFFSLLVLFGVGALAVYMADNWRRPVGYTADHLWVVNVDMRVTGNDTFTASQVETMQRVLQAARELPQVENVAGALMPPYFLGASNRAYEYHGTPDRVRHERGHRRLQGRPRAADRAGSMVRAGGRWRQLPSGRDQRGDGRGAVSRARTRSARTSRRRTSRARRSTRRRRPAR